MTASEPPSGSTSPLAFPGAILVGRYRLEEVVGYGGMGSVWRAVHMGLGENVAVKLVSANFVRSQEALRRFDTEAKAAARIRSRHVPQVFDNGVLEDGTPFLVMELLQGESLAARIHRLGPIPIIEAATILDQCCRALARAHSLGIVHRDIKPENIFLAHSVDDDGYVVKVLDFGIAKVTTALTDDGRSSTRTGTLLGTPLYMSPEQARGLRGIDARTDIYSLGLVTYTMLTGRLPFSGVTLGDLLLQICAEPLPALRALAPNLPPPVEDWFQKACARLPEERFPTAQTLAEGLRIAAGISLSRQTDSLGGKQPPVSAFGMADGASLPPGGAGGLPVPSTTAGASLPGPAPGGRSRWWLVGVAALVGLAAIPLAVLAMRPRDPLPATPPVQATAPPALTAQRADAEVRAALAIATTEATPPAAASSIPEPAAPPSSTAPTARAAPRPASPPPPNATPPARPPGAARPPPKNNGAIDLGY
jgi:serine/threonine-protein kinase